MPSDADHPRGADPPVMQGVDGGVPARLRSRNRLGALFAFLLAAVALLTGAYGLHSSRSVPIFVVGMVVFTLLSWCAAILNRRAARWHAVAEGSFGAGGPGVVGAPAGLHPVRPGAPLRRRLRAQVVPIRTTDGALAAGGALVIHGRRDGIVLANGDAVQFTQLGPRGPYVLKRLSDGAVFAASTGLMSAW